MTRRLAQSSAAAYPSVVEAAGFACVVFAAAQVAAPLGWLVAGVGLLAKSFELNTRRDRP